MKIVAVASGKGGVGKSTVSLNLARALAARGAAVGLLDADVYGPDIPVMLGLKQTRELRRWDLGRNPRFGRLELEPVEALGLKVMSAMLRDAGVAVDVLPPVADDRSILRELPLLGTVPLDPAFARLNGIPEPFLAIADHVAASLG